MQAPQFKFCVTELKKYGCTGTFNTNGLLLNKDMCNFLVEQQFDSVSISIDASTKESLKKTRGITAIDKIIRIWYSKCLYTTACKIKQRTKN